MRELKRKFRVSLLTARRDPLLMFFIIVLACHAAFVLGYLTIAVLNQ